MNAVISTSSLVKHYGSHVALRGIDISVPAGTVMGLIGANGSGKTTTLRLLVDIIRPTSGSIRVLGADPRARERACGSASGTCPVICACVAVCAEERCCVISPRSAALSHRVESTRWPTASTSTCGAPCVRYRRAIVRSSASCRRSCMTLNC